MGSRRARARRQGGRLRGTGALAAFAAGVAAFGVGRASAAPPPAPGPSEPDGVALVAPAGTPLADEIGRELRASHFRVVRVDAAGLATAAANGAPAEGKDRGEDGLWAVPLLLTRGVLVAPDERRVTVFERVGSSGELFSRTDLRIDPRDPQVRRHACFAVVEYLRVMTMATGPGAGDGQPPAAARAELPSAPARPADDPPAAPTVATEAAAGVPVRHQRPWTLGVAAQLALDTGLGDSTTGLQFAWHFRLGPHLGIRALMLWPLVGATVTRLGTTVRLWEFGTGVALHYAFVAAPSPVRPFVGAGVGTRFTLTQTFAPATPEDDGRTVVTPSVNLGIELGVACRVARFAEAFFETAATRERLVPGLERSGISAAAASALTLSSELGVMFEY